MTAPEIIPGIEDPPSALLSEREILSAAIWSPDRFSLVEAQVSTDDFWHPMHREIWREMVRMSGQGTPIEPTTVMTQFASRGTALTDKVLDLCSNRFAVGQNLGWHLGQLETASIARNFQETLIRGHQAAVNDWAAGDLGQGAMGVIEDVIEQLRVVQGMRQREMTTIDFLDIVQRVIPEENWVVPGLLASGERLLLTAAEGWGKSTLIRQMAACIAAGLHPFTFRAQEPRRVLVFDAENPQSVNTVEWGRLHESLDNLGANGRMPERGVLEIEERGPCDLLDPKQAASLYDLVETIRPNVIFIGPLYQLFEGNANDEEPAKKLARVLDRARMICGSAMVVEAHTPHQEMVKIYRPFGASLWKRWPEFGFCLHDDGSTDGLQGVELARVLAQRNSYFTAWRGSRSAGRDWPIQLSAGRHMPWESMDQRLRMQEPPAEPFFQEPEPPEDMQEQLDIG